MLLLLLLIEGSCGKDQEKAQLCFFVVVLFFMNSLSLLLLLRFIKLSCLYAIAVHSPICFSTCVSFLFLLSVMQLQTYFGFLFSFAMQCPICPLWCARTLSNIYYHCFALTP